MDILGKIKQAGLRGRGGAGFLTCLKWEAVKNAPGKKKYVIGNAAEGEPGVFKDGFILENHAEEVVKGIKFALEAVGGSEAFIYLRQDYFDKFKDKLTSLIKDSPIRLFRKTCGYLCGEETTLTESIEGNREEPRAKPPYPTEEGLYGCPTLINNIETFYHVAQIAEDKYRQTRFYSLSGDLKNPGVYELPESLPIAEILKETKNWPPPRPCLPAGRRGRPDHDFFVQSGGGASGEILTPEELNRPAGGLGAIIVYDKAKTDILELMKKWIDFYLRENCGQCVPCREGVYRLNEILNSPKMDWELFKDVLFVLRKTSFCPLGKGVVIPLEGLIKKILKK